MAFTLDYDKWIHLDAEDLAETGMAEAYERLLPELRKYIPKPARFYAINCANDLGGMFLTPAQARDSRASLPRPQDWPYLPKDEPPWFGQHH